MRGRKKTTLLLVLVLAFTFLFIVAAILLETSMSETKKRQRQQLYGNWHGAYMEASPEIRKQLSGEQSVSRMAETRVLGVDQVAGTIGTITQEFMDVGNLKLTDGRLPKSENEILVEASAADSLGISNPVGETVKLSIVNPLVSENIDDYRKMQMNGVSAGGGIDEEAQRTFWRKLYEREQIGNLTLTLNSRFCCMAAPEQMKDPGYIEENGLLFDQNIEVEGEYRIVGVIQSYSAFWDAGTYSMPNVFLSEAGGSQMEEALHNTKLMDLSEMIFPWDLFMESDSLGEHLTEELEKTYAPGNEKEADSRRALRRNLFAYPEGGTGSENTVTFLVVILIFSVTFCAVLQIFLTQIKKRTRKIALLKSIGCTNGQVFWMLIWEGVYLLIYSMPIGVAAGFGIGWGAVKFLHHGMGMEVSFYMKPGLLTAGILLGCAALFAGMAVPVIRALHVPLVGAISVAGKKRRKKGVRERLGTKRTEKRHRLTFLAVSRSHERLNWKNRILTGVITAVTSILLFSALYLGYLSFGTYRETVTEEKRPDYVLYAPHGYRDFEIKRIAEEIEAEKEGSAAESYQRLNKVCLLYDGIEESPLISAYKKYLPEEQYPEFIGSEPTGIEATRGWGDLSKILGGIRTTAYGLDVYGSLYEKIREMVTVGQIDENSFIAGDSVILAVPLYTEGKKTADDSRSVPESVTDDEMFSYVLEELGGYQLSYDEKDNKKMLCDTSVEPGDVVQISVKEEEFEHKRAVRYFTWDIRVDGIIYYTPGEKTFPLFSSENGFTILGSTGFLHKISMTTRYNPMEVWTPEQFEFVLTQCPTKFGETYINIHTDDKANAVESATKLMKYGKNWNMEFINYNEENWNLYYRGLNTAMILAVFAATSLMIAMMILRNIHMSSFEQERGRIGILQALGVTNREFALRYLTNGIKTGVISLVITHILLGAVIFMTAGSFSGLTGYPWKAHILLGMVYFVLVTAVGCGPIRELKKYAPNENIMS